MMRNSLVCKICCNTVQFEGSRRAFKCLTKNTVSACICLPYQVAFIALIDLLLFLANAQKEAKFVASRFHSKALFPMWTQAQHITCGCGNARCLIFLDAARTSAVSENAYGKELPKTWGSLGVGPRPTFLLIDSEAIFFWGGPTRHSNLRV